MRRNRLGPLLLKNPRHSSLPSGWRFLTLPEVKSRPDNRRGRHTQNPSNLCSRIPHLADGKLTKQPPHAPRKRECPGGIQSRLSGHVLSFPQGSEPVKFTQNQRPLAPQTSKSNYASLTPFPCCWRTPTSATMR